MAEKSGSRVTPTNLTGKARITTGQVAAAVDQHVAECGLNWERSDEHRKAIWREICEVKKIAIDNTSQLTDLQKTMIREQVQNRFLIKVFGWFGSGALAVLNGLFIYYLTVGLK